MSAHNEWSSHSRNDEIKRKLNLIRNRSSPHMFTQKQNLESLVTDCIAESVVNAAVGKDTDSSASRIRAEVRARMDAQGAASVSFENPHADMRAHEAEYIEGVHSPTLMVASGGRSASRGFKRISSFPTMSNRALQRVRTNRFSEDPHQQGCVSALHRSLPEQQKLLRAMAKSKRDVNKSLQALNDKVTALNISSSSAGLATATPANHTFGGVLRGMGALALSNKATKPHLVRKQQRHTANEENAQNGGRKKNASNANTPEVGKFLPPIRTSPGSKTATTPSPAMKGLVSAVVNNSKQRHHHAGARTSLTSMLEKPLPPQKSNKIVALKSSQQQQDDVTSSSSPIDLGETTSTQHGVFVGGDNSITTNSESLMVSQTPPPQIVLQQQQHPLKSLGGGESLQDDALIYFNKQSS